MNTGNGRYLTIEETCALLGVSRPTLDSYRTKHGIKQHKVKGRVLFDKLQILQELYVPMVGLVTPELAFSVSREFKVEDSEVVPDVFDLRLIKTIDPFGAMCLLCCLKDRIRNKRQVYLLTGKDSTSLYLRGIRFLEELRRVDSQYVHVDESILTEPGDEPADVILPLHLIGYRGREKAILEELYKRLSSQGFSEDLCASLGWTLGELADNATTHSNGPCYFMLTSQVRDHKFLILTIGDVGVGIPASIKSKDKYSDLTEIQAFVLAFKSDVTSWDDRHGRGRGLNDLLGVAKGNDARVRAESNGQSVLFDFQKNDDDLRTLAAGTKATGTRYCVVLIDSKFDATTRSEMDRILDSFLETL